MIFTFILREMPSILRMRVHHENSRNEALLVETRWAIIPGSRAGHLLPISSVTGTICPLPKPDNRLSLSPTPDCDSWMPAGRTLVAKGYYQSSR
jgi:hypothetical protein